MSNTIKNDMLLTALAVTTQSVEALWKRFDQQKELVSHLSRSSRLMVNGFYSNGYFVPQGYAWGRFNEQFMDTFGFSFEDDLTKMDEPEFRRKLYDIGAPDELVNAALAFIDAFEG